MTRTRTVVLLLFVTLATMSWQSSSHAQAIARVGVVVSELTEAESRRLGLSNRGVYVVDVRSDTSAARAGVLARDVIFELDGDPIEGVDDFLCRVARRRPGDSVQFRILRGLEPLTIAVSLGTWSRELSRARRLPAGCGIADAEPHPMSPGSPEIASGELSRRKI
jgi:Txe/YoeB family toxin of Txe-Axe toxin-antitoxin module